MKDKVKKILYEHGIYPMLLALKEYQEDEMYERCIYIKKAIDDVSKGREQWHTSSLDNENIDRIVLDLKTNHPLVYKNMWYYRIEVLNKLSNVFNNNK